MLGMNTKDKGGGEFGTTDCDCQRTAAQAVKKVELCTPPLPMQATCRVKEQKQELLLQLKAMGMGTWVKEAKQHPRCPGWLQLPKRMETSPHLPEASL